MAWSGDFSEAKACPARAHVNSQTTAPRGADWAAASADDESKRGRRLRSGGGERGRRRQSGYRGRGCLGRGRGSGWAAGSPQLLEEQPRIPSRRGAADGSGTRSFRRKEDDPLIWTSYLKE